MQWTQSSPAILASFLASFVEFVEALTIVLAVGVTRGWRSAIAGALTAALVLAAIVGVVGPNLRFVPVRGLQLALGVLLLLFGLRWLKKAILRSAGVLKPHDEQSIFAQRAEALRLSGIRRIRMLDGAGFVASFQAVLVEGAEVIFIVIAIGAAGDMLAPASLGALAAGILVLLLGMALHRPLSRVPENMLKMSVGVLVSAFGVFWIGEGLGLAWPGHDWAIAGLIALFAVAAACLVRLAARFE